MVHPVWGILCVIAALSACTGAQTGSGYSSNRTINTLPEGLTAIVGPNQDLNAVRISPSDGCYEYRYVGPVETTYLPLRAKNGRPICSRAPDPDVTV